MAARPVARQGAPHSFDRRRSLPPIDRSTRFDLRRLGRLPLARAATPAPAGVVVSLARLPRSLRSTGRERGRLVARDEPTIERKNVNPLHKYRSTLEAHRDKPTDDPYGGVNVTAALSARAEAVERMRS